VKEIFHGNMLDILKFVEDNSVDAVVTDPPYGLKFMGKKWDYDVPTVAEWKECLRVLKPGGYLLSFAGTRTQHRMATNIEYAGFEIRDMIAWVYGSGFPKSLNISKQLDIIAGVERNIIGQSNNGSGAQPHKINNHETGDTGIGYMDGSGKSFDITESSSDEAKAWDGWGTALKPALEPITMARKPLSEKNIAENILKWGVGGINIDGCRVPLNGQNKTSGGCKGDTNHVTFNFTNNPQVDNTKGRFPANLILSYPENEYICKDNLTQEQINRLHNWLNENT
jgi:hypothetical protein